MGIVKEMTCKAGDCVICELTSVTCGSMRSHAECIKLLRKNCHAVTEATTHGTLPWTADHERRNLIVRYTPGTCPPGSDKRTMKHLLPVDS